MKRKEHSKKTKKFKLHNEDQLPSKQRKKKFQKKRNNNQKAWLENDFEEESGETQHGF